MLRPELVGLMLLCLARLLAHLPYLGRFRRGTMFGRPCHEAMALAHVRPSLTFVETRHINSPFGS